MKTAVLLGLLLAVVSAANADVYIYVTGDSKVVMGEPPPVEMGALEQPESITGGTGLRASEMAALQMLVRAREQREAARARSETVAGGLSERQQTCLDLYRIMNDPFGMSRAVGSTQALYQYHRLGCSVQSPTLMYELNPIRR